MKALGLLFLKQRLRLSAATVLPNATGVVAQLKGGPQGATFSKLSGDAKVGVAANGDVSLSSALGDGVAASFVARAVNANGDAVDRRVVLTGKPLVTPAPAPATEILVVAGQSNAMTAGVSGSAGLPAGWADSDRVRIWDSNTSSWLNYSPSAQATWGPEVKYALNWIAANPTGWLPIVKSAVGATQLGDTAIYGQSGSSPLDWSQTSGELFPATTAILNAAKASLGGNVPVKTVLWLQGEQEASQTNLLNAFVANGTELYTKIRSDWGDADTKIVAHVVNTTYANALALLTRQQTVAALNPRNFIANTQGLAFSDFSHMTPASVNTWADRAWKLVNGIGQAPTGVVISNQLISSSAIAGDTVGILSAPSSPDVTAPTAFSLITATSNYEIVGTALRVRSGAALVNDTTENLTIRATAPNGATADLALTVSVGGWWEPTAVIDLDYQNGRFYVNGVQYASAADMVSAGAATAFGVYHKLPVSGFLPAEYSIVARGTNPAGHATQQYMLSLDDGGDGVLADELVAILRQVTPQNTVRFFRASAGGSNLLGTGGGSVDNAEWKIAARVNVGGFRASQNGGAAVSPTANITAMPAVNQLVVGNVDDGSAAYTGTIKRVQILNTLLSVSSLATTSALS